MARPSELWLERVGGLVTRLHARGTTATVTYDFERGRSVTPAGTRRFTGPPPHAARLEALQRVDPGEADDALRLLSRTAFRHGAELMYFSVAVRRRRERAESSFGRSYSVWALTGWATTKSGRQVPVGRSGRGDGLAALRDPQASEELASVVAEVDRASLGEMHDGGVVLMPGPAALLVHEAVGHFAEASPTTDLRYRLGYRIAAERFDIVDDPLAAGGAACYGVDDEGVRTFGPTQIVREGVLVTQLHSLATAQSNGVGPTANARAESVWFEPSVRMSNVVCRAGRTPVAGLVENLWRGLVVHAAAEGWTLGGRLGARLVLAEEVERGRLTGRFRSGGSLAAPVALFTRAVELGDRSVFGANAMCGKDGQLLCDVGTSAPAILLTRLAVVR